MLLDDIAPEEPTHLQGQKELKKLYALTLDPNSPFRVYYEIACGLDDHFNKARIKIFHGYESVGDYYLLVWGKRRLSIKVGAFDGKHIYLRLSTSLNEPIKGETILEKYQLYPWLDALVGEIFLQAL